MALFEIYTDSSCDLPIEMVEKYDLRVMQLEVIMDEEPPVLNRDIEAKAFYDRLRNGTVAKTAAVTPGFFEEHMRKSLEAGKDILYIGFSSGLSTTYNTGAMIAEELKADFPERKILYMDSLCASAGQGMLVYYAALERETGGSIEEVYAHAMEMKDIIHHEVTVDDLFFLKRGGRISAATAVAGSILNVKPRIVMNQEGKLETVGKVRGRKQALKDLVSVMKETADLEDFPYVMISHGDCPEDAQHVKELVEEAFLQAQVTITYVGPVIGAHTGPGVVALFYKGKGRKGR